MTESQFLALIAEELLITSDVISLETSYRNIPTWTSLNALLIISRLHEETGTMVTAADLANANTLGDVYSLINL